MRMMLPAAAALMLAACSPPPAAGPQPMSPPETAAAAPQHSPDYLTLEKAYADAPAPTITAITPTPGVARSLHITGTAPAIWFIENQFPITLADRSGKVLHAFSTRPIEEEPDLSQPVAWQVDLAYAEGETPALLILTADQDGGGWDYEDPPAPPEFRLPLAVTPR